MYTNQVNINRRLRKQKKRLKNSGNRKNARCKSTPCIQSKQKNIRTQRSRTASLVHRQLRCPSQPPRPHVVYSSPPPSIQPTPAPSCATCFRPTAWSFDPRRCQWQHETLLVRSRFIIPRLPRLFVPVFYSTCVFLFNPCIAFVIFLCICCPLPFVLFLDFSLNCPFALALSCFQLALLLH